MSLYVMVSGCQIRIASIAMQHARLLTYVIMFIVNSILIFHPLMCMKLVAHTAAYYAAAVSLLLLSSLFASLALIVAFIHIRSYSTTYSSLSERQRTKKGDGSHLGVGNNQLLIKSAY